MIYPVEALAGSLSPNTKRPHIRLIDPIRMTKRCHSLFSNREYVFLICRAIVATKAIKLLQIHATMDINDATRIKNTPCQKLNALSGILGSSLLAFICIKVNRVEAVAVVATHAVIRPTPQMTWPATKSAGAGEDMSKIKPARKVMVAERYPRIGKANLATLLYVWII